MSRTRFLVTGNIFHGHVVHCICRAPLMFLTGLSVCIVYNGTVQVSNCNMSWNHVVNIMTGLWAG